MSSPGTFYEYLFLGVDGSVAVRAMGNSHFLLARHGGYEICDAAFIKVAHSTSDDPIVIMNFQITAGLSLTPYVLQAKIEYPDGTFSYTLPVSDIKVLSISSVYRCGRTTNYIDSPAEVYGLDSVLVMMSSLVLEKLNQSLTTLYYELYPGDNKLTFGVRDPTHQGMSIAPCRVRPGARCYISVNDNVSERRLDHVVSFHSRNELGDALLSVMYEKNTSERTSKLIFALEYFIIRQDGGKILQIVE